MKHSLPFFIFLLLFAATAQAQPYSITDKKFQEAFTFLYNSAGHFFKEVKGPPIISTMFGQPDTIGYRVKFLPEGVTDWKHISGSNSEEQTLFFKLGEYSKDSAEVAKRFTDLLALVKKIDSKAVFEYDNSYSDTKVKEVRICPAGAKSCGEDDRWRLSLYFHRFSGDEFNVSVNLQSYPDGK